MTHIVLEKRKHVLWLQWLLVVVIAYLLYFGGVAQTANPYAVFALIGVNTGLNASLFFLSPKYFHSRIFDSLLAFFNLVMVLLAIYLTHQTGSDFYLFFFLVLMMAAAGQNFKTFFLVLIATLGLYILVVSRSGVFSFTTAFLIRIPFLFIVGIFFGYLLYIQKLMEERLQAESEFTADLFEFGKALAQAEDLPILYSKIPKLINEIMMTDACELAIIDGEQITYRCFHEQPGEVPTVDINQSIHAATYRTDEIFLSSALQEAPQFTKKQDFHLYPYRHYIAKSWKPEGRRAGLLAVYRNGKEKWSTHDIKKFQFLTDQTVLGLKYAQVLKEFQKQARTDGLTGLANYGYFSEKLEQDFARAQREKTPLSLIVMDVDHFKSINDTRGHAAGDRVLRSLAAVLKHVTPSMVVAGRCGGDEFSVLLPKTDKDEALDICQRLIEKVKTLNQTPRFSISVGCSTFPHDGASAPKLFAHADEALYFAKARGRGCVCHYRERPADVGPGVRCIRPVQSKEDLNLEPFLGEKVLVVDDASQVLDVLRRFLKARGLLFVGASNAEEAITKFAEQRPRVVFLDIYLPDRNGLEVLEEIHRTDPDMGVIMITGAENELLRSKALEMRASDFLTKPFDFGQLESVLWANLQSASSRQLPAN